MKTPRDRVSRGASAIAKEVASYLLKAGPVGALTLPESLFGCCGLAPPLPVRGCDGAGVLAKLPRTCDGRMITSTRRFCDLPASLVFGAVGR